MAVGPIVLAKFRTRPSELEETEMDLRWIDVGYERADKRKVFGGVLGEIEITTNCRVTAWLLRMGQLFGVGELTRMGFGRYEIFSCRSEPHERICGQTKPGLCFTALNCGRFLPNASLLTIYGDHPNRKTFSL